MITLLLSKLFAINIFPTCVNPLKHSGNYVATQNAYIAVIGLGYFGHMYSGYTYEEQL